MILKVDNNLALNTTCLRRFNLSWRFEHSGVTCVRVSYKNQLFLSNIAGIYIQGAMAFCSHFTVQAHPADRVVVYNIYYMCDFVSLGDGSKPTSDSKFLISFAVTPREVKMVARQPRSPLHSL